MRKDIIFFQGGLGNQMFQYAFFLVRKKMNLNVDYDISLLKHQNQHNGYELERIFDKESRSNCLNFFCLRVLYYAKCHSNLACFKLLIRVANWLGMELFIDSIPSIYTNIFSTHKKNFFLGYWQTEKYFCHIEKEIQATFEFKRELLSPETARFLRRIIETNSVSIHIRRGDYLSEINQGLYGGICTEMYYAKAITYICNKIDQPSFFVFSNEIDWVKNNVDIPNPTYIDFNNGADSWQDMFLMSQCKHNIIANSSFSWWGAWLNRNTNKIVITPSCFINLEEDSDIIPDTWIRI